MSWETALAELERNRGRQFCPFVVEAFKSAAGSFPPDLVALISDSREDGSIE
jgi:HD-GYP domain-containing protein (c-di-GMP phosphodiesterase class II)